MAQSLTQLPATLLVADTRPKCSVTTVCIMPSFHHNIIKSTKSAIIEVEHCKPCAVVVAAEILVVAAVVIPVVADVVVNTAITT